MKKCFLAISFSLLALSSMAQQSIMRCMSGYINTYPVTMFLCHEDNYYFGSYYFDDMKVPIEIYGALDSSGLIILESDIGIHTGRFTGRLRLNGYEGEWFSDMDSISYAFYLYDNDYGGYFEWVSYNEHRLWNEKEEYPYASFYAGGTFPLNTLNTCDTIRKVLFMDATTASEYEKQIIDNSKSFFKDFDELNKNENTEEMGMAGTRETYSIIFPVYIDSAEVVFKLYSYDYLGGAHGMSSTLFFMFDRKNNRYIPETALLQNIHDDVLRTILYKNFVLKYGEENAVMLFSNERALPLPDNFYITPKAICFQYQEYEIGPYAMGNLLVDVPLIDVIEYLTPYAKEIFLR